MVLKSLDTKTITREFLIIHAASTKPSVADQLIDFFSRILAAYIAFSMLKTSYQLIDCVTTSFPITHRVPSF